MTKILNKKNVPKTDALIFKRERSKYWYVSFYVGRCKSPNGMFQQSLKEENYKDALKKALKIYKQFWIDNEVKDKDEQVVRRTHKFNKVANEFIKIRIKEKGTEGQRELGKWNNHFVHYFGGMDIRDMDKVNETLRDSILARKEEGNVYPEVFSLEEVPLQEGNWLVIARTNRKLLDIIPALKSMGIYYEYKQRKSFSKKL